MEEQRTVRISEGVQAVIELLESIPVRVKDLDSTGYALRTAVRNLISIREAVIRAENGGTEETDETVPEQAEPLTVVPDIPAEAGDQA